jgi:mono/diheme cytochrome c family protein
LRNSVAAFSALALAFLSIPAARAADDAAVAGKELYHTYCVICHGPNMQQNTNTRSFDLRKFPLGERQRFDTAVIKGKNQMPAWGDVLTPDQLDLLWAYVKTRGQT